MQRQAVLDTVHDLVREGRDGFTVDQDGHEFRSDTGFAVGYQRYATPEAAVDDMTPGLYLGYWREPATRTQHFDLVQVFAKLPTAMLAAYTRMEMAIYDFAADDLIDISSFYVPGPTSTPSSPTDTATEGKYLPDEEETDFGDAAEPQDDAS